MNTREFLRSLLDRTRTPRVPMEIRKQAYYCLKHFPGEYDIDELGKKLPKTWGRVEKE